MKKPTRKELKDPTRIAPNGNFLLRENPVWGSRVEKNPAAIALGRMTSAKKKASSTANALKASKAAALARASLKEKK